MTAERDRLLERRATVRRDIEELAAQVEHGEVSEETAARLQLAYVTELESLDTTLGDVAYEEQGRAPNPSTPESAPVPAPVPAVLPPEPANRSPKRLLTGAVLLVAVLSVAIFLAARDTRQQNPEQASDSSPGELLVDPASVSNEQLEQVVAANPNVNGMRMALADRYFSAEDYGAALDHYLYIADHEPTPAEATKALTRIGWMAYRTGLPEEAMDYLEAGLAIDPGNTEARLFLGFVTLYGVGDAEAAVPQLEAALELPNLSENVVSQIEDALVDARVGSGS